MAVKKKITNADLSGVRIECFMLCNFAQVESGKLSIIGGGWSEVVVPNFPAPFAYFLAIRLAVPAGQKELLAQMRIRLVEEQRSEVIDDRSLEVNLKELGGLGPDTRGIDVATVMFMQLEIARAGRFHNELWIANQMVTRSGFLAKEGVHGHDSSEQGNPIG